MSSKKEVSKVGKSFKGINRREFIAGAGAAAFSFAVVKPGAVRGTEANSKLKLGMIGCGMRGTDITERFLEHGGYEVVAAADYFPKKVDAYGEKYGVPLSKRFTTLSGYKSLLEQDVDVVAIESPPYFHPEQAAAAVEAGKHVYVAKPIAVDVPGCNLIGASGKKASDNKLCFIADFQTRADGLFREAVKRVQYGDIGRILYGEAYFVTGPTWLTWNPIGKILMEKPNDPEAKLEGWGLSKELSGDIITEQAIHSLDVASWILDEEALSAYGTCALKSRKIGTTMDYFVVVYQFPKDIALNFTCKQGGADEFGGTNCRMYGTEGDMDSNYGGMVSIRGNTPYKGGETTELYWDGVKKNISDFYDNIVKGRYGNTTVPASVRSVLTSILGRNAAYKGELMTWKQMMNANEKLEADLSGLKM